jgi:hypothetical protein
MQRNLVNLAIIAGVLLAITACVCRSDREQDKSTDNQNRRSERESVVNNNAVPVKAPTRSEDTGDFTVQHIEVSNPKYEEIDRQVRAEKLLENAAERLNRSLILPHNIDQCFLRPCRSFGHCLL